MEAKCVFGMKGENRIWHIGADRVKNLQKYFCTAASQDVRQI